MQKIREEGDHGWIYYFWVEAPPSILKKAALQHISSRVEDYS